MSSTGSKGSSLHVRQEAAATERGTDRPPTPLRGKEGKGSEPVTGNPRGSEGKESKKMRKESTGLSLTCNSPESPKEVGLTHLLA